MSTDQSARQQFMQFLEANESDYFLRCKKCAETLLEALELEFDDRGALIMPYEQDELTAEQADSLKDDWVGLSNELDKMRASTATRMAAHLDSVKPHVTEFFAIRSVFSDLGDPDLTHFDLNEHSKRFLNKLAPESPTIDSFLELDVASNGVLTIKQVGTDSGSGTPLFFSVPSDSVKPKKAQNTIPEGMKDGFISISKTTLSYILFTTTNAHLNSKFGLFVNGPNYGVEWNNIMLNAYVSKEAFSLGQRFHSNEELNYVVFSNSMPQFVPCNSKPGVVVNASVFKYIKSYNSTWVGFHNAQREWEVGLTSLPKAKQKLMIELVLLDMSRFGWAPCWSTPENAPTRLEDGKADTFKNDLAQFQKFGKVAIPILQSQPQWKCAQFMHTPEFTTLRRGRFLHTSTGLFASELRNTEVGKRLAKHQWWLNGENDPTSFANYDYANKKKVFLDTVDAYSRESNNDIAAICICFAATEILLRARVLKNLRSDNTKAGKQLLNFFRYTVLQGEKFQTMSTIQRMRILAFKSISVPAHEALKQPVLAWLEDCRVVGSFFENEMQTTATRVRSIAKHRKQLVEAFILTSKTKANRPSIIKSGIPCALAFYCYDHPSLCARVRIRLPDVSMRDDALEKLKKDVKVGDIDVKSLVDDWDAKRPDADIRQFLKERREVVKRFVQLHHASSTDLQWEATKRAFQTIMRNRPIRRVKQQTFRCEEAVKGILNQATISSGANINLLDSKRSQTLPDSYGAAAPLIFADPYHETDILMVVQIDIGNVAQNVRIDNLNMFVPADVEIDSVARQLQKLCPEHEVPSEDVQKKFQAVYGAIRVVRMDWWIGNRAKRQIEEYSHASLLAPLVPYRMNEGQLLNSVVDDATAQQNCTPFDDANVAADSIEKAENKVKKTIARVLQNKEAHIESSKITKIFSDERSVELDGFQSLGRVCKIAFELLKGNIFINGAPIMFEGMASQSIDYISYRIENVVPETIGTRRAKISDPKKGTDSSYNNALVVNALLPPFQHAKREPFDERKFEYQRPFLLSDPQSAVGAFRYLQFRISSASFVLGDYLQIYQNSDFFVSIRGEFETVSQSAARYNTNANYTIKEGTVDDQNMMLVSQFLFPSEFVSGRRHEDISNEQVIATVADRGTIDANSKVADLYIQTAIANSRALETHTLGTNSTSHATKVTELKQILLEMAEVANGMHAAPLFLERVGKAAKKLREMKRGYRTRFKSVPQTIDDLGTALRPLFENFASNHAKLEDAIRSYADMTSIGINRAPEFVERFLSAYKSLRTFRMEFDKRQFGMFNLLVHTFAQTASAGGLRDDSSKIVKSVMSSIERIMTSRLLLKTSTQLNQSLNLETLVTELVPNIEEYGTISAKFHMNTALGCVTSAVAFRNLSQQRNDSMYTLETRKTLGIDTLGGYEGNPEFHCFLPTARDVFADGVSTDICNPNTEDKKKKGNVNRNRREEEGERSLGEFDGETVQGELVQIEEENRELEYALVDEDDEDNDDDDDI